MLFAKLYSYLRGYVIMTVSGPYIERFLNVCAARGILLWNLFPCGEKVLKCHVSMAAFKLLSPIARKTNVQIKILKKCGLPILLTKLKKRIWFVSGLLLCLSLLIVLNQFIWKIEIIGCETISPKLVEEKLAENGLTIGAFRPFINEKKLQNQILINTPELVWLWADKHGSKVIVQVKERTPAPPIHDEHTLANIIATKDGVIESMIIKNGNPMVALGDTVRKGDLLVSGLILSEKDVPPRTVQSEGEIYARVWYEKTKAFSLWSPVREETGKQETKTTLHLFSKDVSFFKNAETTFTDYDIEETEWELSLFGRYLGIGFSRRTFSEISVTYEKISAESTARNAILELSAEIDTECAPGSKKQNTSSDYKVLDNDTIEVTVLAEYLENIAEKVLTKSQEEVPKTP